MVLVLLVVGMFVHGDAARVLWVLAIAGLIYVYFRMFSRKVSKRRAENEKYLRATAGLVASTSAARASYLSRPAAIINFLRCPPAAHAAARAEGQGQAESSLPQVRKLLHQKDLR
ncbi:MAG: hypothetical protein ACLTSG_03920 [Lachnospiraceae bacterium]